MSELLVREFVRVNQALLFGVFLGVAHQAITELIIE